MSPIYDFSGKTLVIATHNEGKVKEISALLAPYIGDFVSAGALGLVEPEEDGESFSENAAIKARAAAAESGRPALADDSGFCVNALGGAPGIYSARWAGPEKDFGKAMARVNDALEGYEDRSCYFICVLALAHPDGTVRTFEGRIDGQMLWPPRGEQGFGYDPIFLPNGHDKSFGEMAPAEKQAISHRRRAFDAMIATLFPDYKKAGNKGG